MSPVITSLQNQRIKDAIKLRDRRPREKQQRTIIDGAREIMRAIQADVSLPELFVCPSLCNTDEAQNVLFASEHAVVERLEVTAEVFEKLAFGQRTEGVVAVASTPRITLDDLQLAESHSGESPLVAVLEGLEKPGNIGAILRSADAAGISAVIVADGGTDLYNPNTIRASLGAIFTLPVCRASSAATADWLQEQQIEIFASRVDGAVDYNTVDYTRRCAIELGSETAGLSETWSGKLVTAIKLPMQGAIDSLNVSATAAVLFYEARRQCSVIE